MKGKPQLSPSQALPWRKTLSILLHLPVFIKGLRLEFLFGSCWFLNARVKKNSNSLHYAPTQKPSPPGSYNLRDKTLIGFKCSWIKEPNWCNLLTNTNKVHLWSTCCVVGTNQPSVLGQSVIDILTCTNRACFVIVWIFRVASLWGKKRSMLGLQYRTMCKLFFSSFSIIVFSLKPSPPPHPPFLHVIYGNFKFLFLAMIALMNSNLAFQTGISTSNLIQVSVIHFFNSWILRVVQWIILFLLSFSFPSSLLP